MSRMDDQPDKNISDPWSQFDSEAGQPPVSVSEAAKRYVAAGLSVIPIADDGTKGPYTAALPRVWDEHQKRTVASWKPYQVCQPTEADIDNWSADGRAFGLAVITGAVSGVAPGCGLEMIDFDCMELFAPWVEKVEQQAPGLLRRLVQVQTPRPGRHIYYRCSEFAGSQKLARANEEIAAPDGSLQRKSVTLIETRGEGAYCIIPPSPPWCHPGAKCYRYVEGSLDLTEVPLITPAERSVLLSTARSFDQSPPPKSSSGRTDLARRASRTAESETAGRPGDAFNQEANWEDILDQNGWVQAGRNGRTIYWRRPGKDFGVSATTGYCESAEGEDRLHVFSSNAEPFEGGHTYSKFAAYALLEHRGDFAAAAGELRRQGYGGGDRPLKGSSK